MRCLSTALALEPQRPADRIHLLLAESAVQFLIDNLSEATASLDEALQLCGLDTGRTRALIQFARALVLQTSGGATTEEATALLDEAGGNARGAGNAFLRARITAAKAIFAYWAGDLDAAEAGLSDAIASYADLRATASEGSARGYLAEVWALQGRTDALAMAHQASDLVRASGDAIYEGDAFLTLGIAHALVGDRAHARRHLADAILVFDRHDRTSEIAIAIHAIGATAAVERDWPLIAAISGTITRFPATQPVPALAAMWERAIRAASDELSDEEYRRLHYAGRRMTVEQLTERIAPQE